LRACSMFSSRDEILSETWGLNSLESTATTLVGTVGLIGEGKGGASATSCLLHTTVQCEAICKSVGTFITNLGNSLHCA
jgi:hypothetical protein